MGSRQNAAGLHFWLLTPESVFCFLRRPANGAVLVATGRREWGSTLTLIHTKEYKSAVKGVQGLVYLGGNAKISDETQLANR